MQVPAGGIEPPLRAYETLVVTKRTGMCLLPCFHYPYRKGHCSYGYKVGDKWDVNGLKCIDGFCGAGWHVCFPALFQAMKYHHYF